MIIIQIAHMNIALDLKYEKEMKNLSAYQTDSCETFSIQTRTTPFPIAFHELVRSTTFYDVYKVEEGILQVQKQQGKEIGYIFYQNKKIDIYLIKDDFATEYLLSQYALLYLLQQQKNTLFLHGSSIVYHKKGILFCAKSGTGKSTQARLWRTYTDAVSLNDDKNILVYEKKELYLYPSPWSGKHQLNQNVVAPLKAIVFLHQAKENQVKLLKPIEAMRLLLGQMEAPTKDSYEDWNHMVDAILELPIYEYGCNMEKDAVLTLKSRLEMDICL